jgi:Transposase IS66 family
LHRALVIFKKSRRYLPRSAMGQAIDYALSNWPLLGVFLEDGRIEIGNNLVENSIRPTALGKKNWLFFGDANAGERSVARQEKKGRGAVMGEDCFLSGSPWQRRSASFRSRVRDTKEQKREPMLHFRVDYFFHASIKFFPFP